MEARDRISIIHDRASAPATAQAAQGTSCFGRQHRDPTQHEIRYLLWRMRDDLFDAVRGTTRCNQNGTLAA